MPKLNFLLIFTSILLIVNCRQPPYRYQFFATQSTTPSTTSTTTLPSTTSQPSTTNSSVHHLPQRLNHKTGPYNKYLENGLEYILPMLGHTKSTTTTPSSTTPLAINPLESIRQRVGNRFCVDRTTCPYCAYEGTTCCFKSGSRGVTSRGECRCVTKVSELNKCD